MYSDVYREISFKFNYFKEGEHNMRKFKKVTAVLLAGIMAASMFAGCGKEEDDKKQDTTASTQGTTQGSTEGSTAEGDSTGKVSLPELKGDSLKLTVNIADFGQTSDGKEMQQLWQEKMEAYLGCKLDITWQRTPWNDFRSNEMVILQSGDLPDISTYSQGTAINEFGEDEMVLNLADYKDYMPNYLKYVNDTNGGYDFAFNSDGSSYYFMDGFYNEDNIMGAQSFTAFAYRFDELKKNNLTPAVTLDEFDKLCADLKGLIDSGKTDAKYVMMNSDKNYAFYRGFVGIFHTWDTLYWNGEEWAFGPIDDNFREMLKYMNGLWNAGYIDPEMGTADGNAATTKATTGNALICPTTWAGNAASWNKASLVDGMEWGLAYLPKNETYGTPWKWGSKQDGKSVQTQMGIYISADVENPEYAVALIDYQYSDEIVEMMNWGIEGKTYTKDADGRKTFSDEIMNDDSPATKSADYGIMASSLCRTGIPFIPQDFTAVIAVSSTPEPWWNQSEGFYEGKYWVESDKNGGPDSVSPYDRPPVLRITSDQSTAKNQLSVACETYAKEYAYKFITGEWDVNDDAKWDEYIKGVKSQSEENFDDVIAMLNENSVK